MCNRGGTQACCFNCRRVVCGVCLKNLDQTSVQLAEAPDSTVAFLCPHCHRAHLGKYSYTVSSPLCLHLMQGLTLSVFKAFCSEGLDGFYNGKPATSLYLEGVKPVHLGDATFITPQWREDTASLLIVHIHLQSIPDPGSAARVAFEALKAAYPSSSTYESLHEVPSSVQIIDDHALCYLDCPFLDLHQGKDPLQLFKLEEVLKRL